MNISVQTAGGTSPNMTVGLAPADECENEMFITVPWEKQTLAVPLAQLEPIRAEPATQQAVGDWHYWVEQGYQS